MSNIELFNKLLELTIWKTIDGYKNYEVSICGSVMNSKTKRILRPRVVGIDGNENYAVYLCKNGKTKNYTIHRFVANAFIPLLKIKNV